MKNRTWKLKALSLVIAASMALSLCPSAVYASDASENTGGGVVTEESDEQDVQVQETESGEDAGSEDQTSDIYVLMNIPYNEFYAEETGSNTKTIDAFTSATKTKTRTYSLAGGSYHEDEEGNAILGVTFPVKLGDNVTLNDLSSYTKVEDTAKVEITTTNRNQTTTTTLTGKETLFQNATYSYYVLTEKPSYYKVMTKNEANGWSFGKVQGDAETLSDATATLSTESSYGDYQMSVEGLPDEVETVYGVVLTTTKGVGYGLHHIENIWRISELGWSTITAKVHNCTTSKEYFASLMGETIGQITYYTDQGIYNISLGDGVYVPKKDETTNVSVADVTIENGTATATITKTLPNNFVPEYKLDGETVEVSETGTFTVSTPGKHTLTIEDTKNVYADVVTSFTANTAEIPVKWNGQALVAEEGYGSEDVENYLSNITSVEVNGTSNSTTGKKPVYIFDEDGYLDTTTSPFADATDGKVYTIKITATGYTCVVEFTYTWTTYEYVKNLESAIAEAQKLDQNAYTQESWENLQDELEYAQYVVDSVSKTRQSAFEEELAELKSAISALVKKVTTVDATSVSISGYPSKKLAAGKKVQLTATVAPSNATNKSVTWSTSNKKVATIDQNGVLKLNKKAGGKSVTITATTANGKSASIKIKVMKGAVKSIKLSAKKKTVKSGKTVKVKAKVKTTKKSANKKLTWSSSNTSIATVTSSGKVKTVKGAKGKVKITARATDGSGKKKTITIKVK